MPVGVFALTGSGISTSYMLLHFLEKSDSFSPSINFCLLSSKDFVLLIASDISSALPWRRVSIT
nr:MAG TPA: hypothetical protein [Caudoviricetes sp.]